MLYINDFSIIFGCEYLSYGRIFVAYVSKNASLALGDLSSIKKFYFIFHSQIRYIQNLLRKAFQLFVQLITWLISMAAASSKFLKKLNPTALRLLSNTELNDVRYNSRCLQFSISGNFNRLGTEQLPVVVTMWSLEWSCVNSYF